MKLRPHKSSTTIYQMFCDQVQTGFHWYGHGSKFLEMGFTRARRYANHPSGKNMTPRVIAHHSQQNGATVKN